MVVQWVCLSKWHEWWEFEVPRYREELKDRYGGALSQRVYFLSSSSTSPTRSCRWFLCGCCSGGADAEEVLREADDDDDYEAPGWVTSGVYEILLPGLQLAVVRDVHRPLRPHDVGPVGFYAALWGGGARGSLAQYLLVAMMWENQGRSVGGGKTHPWPSTCWAMIPWQAICRGFDYALRKGRGRRRGIAGTGIGVFVVVASSVWLLSPCYWSPFLLHLC